MSRKSDYDAWVNFLWFFGFGFVVIAFLFLGIGYLAGWFGN